VAVVEKPGYIFVVHEGIDCLFKDKHWDGWQTVPRFVALLQIHEPKWWPDSAAHTAILLRLARTVYTHRL
jgi:hypothetical protein